MTSKIPECLHAPCLSPRTLEPLRVSQWVFGDEHPHVLRAQGGGPGHAWELWESTEGTDLCHMPQIGHIWIVICTKKGSDSPFTAAIFQFTLPMGCLGSGHFLRANDSFILLWATTISPLQICKSSCGCQQLFLYICSNCACVISERHSLLYSLPNLHTEIAFQMHLSIDLAIRHR